MSKLTEQHRLMLVAALALAAGVPVGAALDDGPEPRPLAEVAKETRLDQALVVDTAKYHASIVAAKASVGPNVVDLLTEPVEPGASITTGGSLPKGARFVGKVQLTSDGFRIDVAHCADRDETAWCEVTATNTSDKAQRLAALAEYVLT